MKLAELLNVDTTKENWFKLFSKKGINPKTVNTVSKGGGESIKEYYYRFKEEYLNTNIYDILIMDEMPLIEFLQLFCGIEAIICPIEGSDGIEGYAEVHSNFVISNKLKMIPYFKIMDSSSFIAMSFMDNMIIPSNSIIVRKGNISDRIKNSSVAEEADYIIELINTYIQEISKEEYYNQITYKNQNIEL